MMMILPDLRKHLTKQDGLYLASIAVITVLIRLPFFFEAVINWDESTFILMGQSLLDGHLPYTQLWDLKPPLLFVAYALFILTLGKSILSIRLAGTLCVIIVAILVYFCAKTFTQATAAFLSAIATALGISVLSAGQAVMSEHVAIVPLTAVLAVLFLRPKPELNATFAIAILLTMAALMRLNLGYSVLILGFYLILQHLPDWTRLIRQAVSYSLGSFLVCFLTFFPYWLMGHSKLWWLSVIIAPLNYSDSQLGASQVFNRLKDGLISSSENKMIFGITLLLWLGGAFGIVLSILLKNKQVYSRSHPAIALGLLTISIFISILETGAAHQHYLIQLVPCLGLGFAILWQTISQNIILDRVLFGLTLVLLLSSLTPILTEYRIVGGRLRAGDSLQVGPAYDIAAYFREQEAEDEPIYMMIDHIVYWFLDSQPLTPATTHPSTLSREYVLDVIYGVESSPESEIAKVFAAEPKFVVKERFVRYLLSGNMQPVKTFLERELANHYEQVAQIEGRLIYRRIER
ncbi:hypothetical protein AY600_07870 [Phormidium willei BDU 130791]|nr:hypothetical protein AY600_07870 [Phormidium willei BDU 130791]